MSAWMITNAHADLLADAYVALVDPKADQAHIGRTILLGNAASIEARYGQSAGTKCHAQADAYTYQPFPQADYRTGFVNKQAACADYQACETEDYERRETYRILRALIDATPRTDDLSRFDIPWGIDESHRPTKPAEQPKLTIVNEKAYKPSSVHKLVELKVTVMLDAVPGAWHDPVDVMSWIAQHSYVQSVELQA